MASILLIGALAQSAAWTAEGDQKQAHFGASVATAGDVNGDGYDDVVVGAFGYDVVADWDGRVFVYYGSAVGLATSPSWTADGEAGSELGRAVATAGDVNGDRYADLIVGSKYCDHGETDEGCAFVFYGSPAGLAPRPDWTAEGEQPGAFFGSSVASAGDVNADGYDDVIVGAPGYDNDQTGEGRVFLFLGSATGLATSPAWTAESNQPGAGFGAAVASAGDVNGDDHADVIVGAPSYEDNFLNEGRAFVYRGTPTGLSAGPIWTAEVNQFDAGFGTSVASAGDVNADGYDDVVVGAPDYDNPLGNVGGAFAYYGSPAGLATSASWTAESDDSYSWFGWSVASAGDVNGDGYADVVVGAPKYSLGSVEDGRAFVYHGSAAGLGASRAWTAEGNDPEVDFGISVSTAGDVDGDGDSDVLIGAQWYDNGELDEGRAFVYLGAPCFEAECTAGSGPVSGLRLLGNKTGLVWDPAAGAVGYDVVQGDLVALHAAGGDFNYSLLGCLAAGSSDPSATDESVPSPGDGIYYLVRFQDSCNGFSTYDSGGPSQQGSRDGEIAASENGCFAACSISNPASESCTTDAECASGSCDLVYCLPGACYCDPAGLWNCTCGCLGRCTAP